MSGVLWSMMDGNEAVASVAHRVNDVIAIYPITPASPMGELADLWSTEGRVNLWGRVPDVVEMQSEAGAAGTVHGALQAGALTTTFTASQGLLLMIPNLYKIAGELTSCCLHVAARSIATHALSIFCDHSDVMAARQTGFAFLASSSVQEAHDLALIGQMASLESRVPFLHFFDGFRTSHEIAKIQLLSDDDLRALLNETAIAQHRQRALSPDRPVVRGTAQNPDVFFQAREACNPFYLACPDIVRDAMRRFAQHTGRTYDLFYYAGHPEAERVIVLMGSSVETVDTTARHLADRGERVGVIGVRLYRPFDSEAFVATLPPSTTRVAVLDRTKEPGAVGDPLYLDVVAALYERGRRAVDVIAGRYGLGSKEFTPGMVKAVYDELASDTPRRHFTIGITDDVAQASIAWDETFTLPGDGVVEAVFYGLGSDGTVGANKNSIKIIGGEADRYAQGYFVYDSKKSGAMTVSHLRFGPEPISAPYLIRHATFVACHQFGFLDQFDIIGHAAPGATVLLNAPYPADAVWNHLSHDVQTAIVEKGITLYAIDAHRVAQECGLGVRINTIMQTCFFAITGVLPREQGLAAIRERIRMTYGKRGSVVVEQNLAAVDRALDNLSRIEVPEAVTSHRTPSTTRLAGATDFVQQVTAAMLANGGDHLPVSAFPPDGTWPVGTSRWEKRNLALEIPIWDADVCIQCNWCALVCPHAAIRTKVYDQEALREAPASFKTSTFRGPDFKGQGYTVQVAPEDCTGCHLCVTVCPAKDKTHPRHRAINMQSQAPIRDRERVNYEFFLDLPEIDRSAITRWDAKTSQLCQPLFEYSGACAGCGETPYVKLLTQLFGDRLLVANATGCSSIYGGNLPTTPYTTNREGRGPAWSNSLFEDNAEFGLGFRLAVDALSAETRRLLEAFSAHLPAGLVDALLHASQETEEELAAQRSRVEQLRAALQGIGDAHARRLSEMADYLVRKTVWLVGGDGWAYDIGFGGVDHVLAQDRDVNILVLDTEVYSNTGGQQSKATPLGATAKFAMAGKATPKKDLGMEASSYRHIYVAQVAFGANMNQLVRAFQEADAHRGPSLIIAHSPCIAHGYDLRHAADQQKLAVESGAWPLYRYDPRRAAAGEPPLHLDSKEPKRKLIEYMRNEARFRMTERLDPERFKALAIAAQRDAEDRYAVYKQLATVRVPRRDVEENAEGPRAEDA